MPGHSARATGQPARQLRDIAPASRKSTDLLAGPTLADSRLRERPSRSTEESAVMRSSVFPFCLPTMFPILLTVLTLAVPCASQAERVRTKQLLHATEALPAAQGVARLLVRTSTRGGFGIKAQSLEASTSYDVLVGGIKVAALVTDDKGEARIRFSTAKVKDNLVLGFDPRGEAIEVRSAAGTDVLIGNFAAPAGSESDKACCIPDDERAECEDRTPDECAAIGGTTTEAGSCF